MTISVCIATHERAFLITPTLQSIASQTRLPDEVIVSDSSAGTETEDLINKFAAENPSLTIRYVKSECSSLPYQRLWAFKHSVSDVVLFIDDDIRLNDHTIDKLVKSYELLYENGTNIAGIGLTVKIEEYDYETEIPNNWTLKYLGFEISDKPIVTPGGQSLLFKNIDHNCDMIEVDRLSGRGMSYPSNIIKKIGSLNNLIAIDLKFKVTGEDAIISFSAGRYGKLFLLNEPLAIHPSIIKSTKSYALNGWRQGVNETWGRAHIMRWLATDLKSYRSEWYRVASLELIRAIYWDIIRRPFQVAGWARFTGGLFGLYNGIMRWKSIPNHP